MRRRSTRNRRTPFVTVDSHRKGGWSIISPQKWQSNMHTIPNARCSCKPLCSFRELTEIRELHSPCPAVPHRGSVHTCANQISEEEFGSLGDELGGVGSGTSKIGIESHDSLDSCQWQGGFCSGHWGGQGVQTEVELGEGRRNFRPDRGLMDKHSVSTAQSTPLWEMIDE